MDYIKRKIYNLCHPQVGVMLMLHRVVPQRSTIKLNRDIEVTPDFLEKTILEYKNNGYKFVSPDEAYEIITGKRKINKQFVCFTFDDGYLDNYENALPIFKKYDCPFTIYVTADFIEGKAVVWWYLLDDLLQENGEIALADGRVFSTKTNDEKNSLFELMHKELSILESAELKRKFEYLFSAYEFSFADKVKELSMSKEHLLSISKDPLCTIGAHTVSHPRLSTLTAERQREEMFLSKSYLENITGKDISHFAYPFGDHNADSVKLAEACGYITAVMAWGGKVRRGQNIYLLYRMNLNQA